MLCPVTGPFIFNVLHYPYHSAEPGHVLCVMFIAIQEILAAVLVLHIMAFHSSGNVIALHLYNNTTKAYLFHKIGKYIFFFPE